jgi:hypothetical protein
MLLLLLVLVMVGVGGAAVAAAVPHGVCALESCVHISHQLEECLIASC